MIPLPKYYVVYDSETGIGSVEPLQTVAVFRACQGLQNHRTRRTAQRVLARLERMREFWVDFYCYLWSGESFF